MIARTVSRRIGAVVGLGLALAAGAAAQVGPALPPGFYGELPEPFPGPEAPAGIRRLAIAYSSNIVGEIDPCG